MPDPRYYSGDDEREQGCSEDADTCPCPGCVAWRDLRDEDDLRLRLQAEEENREPSDADLAGRLTAGERDAEERDQQIEIYRTLKN